MTSETSFFLPHVRTFWSWNHGFSMAFQWSFFGESGRWRPCILILTRCAVLEFVKAILRQRQKRPMSASACRPWQVFCWQLEKIRSWRPSIEEIQEKLLVKTKSFGGAPREKRRDTQPCQKYGSLWVSVWSKKTIVGQSTVLGGKHKSKGAGKTAHYILWFLMGDC